MYKYEEQRHNIFTERGQEMFIQIRDHTLKLLDTAGAVSMGKAMQGCSCGDSWTMMTCVDRMVEMGDIKEIAQPKHVWAQNRIFVKR